MPVDKDVVGSQHHDFRRIFELSDFAQGVEAGHIRHHDIEQDHVKVRVPKNLKRCASPAAGVASKSERPSCSVTSLRSRLSSSTTRMRIFLLMNW